jgi:hypothetical protein
MGGVADKKIVDELILKLSSPIRWTNLYSLNDYAVRYLYKTCNLTATPIGG